MNDSTKYLAAVQDPAPDVRSGDIYELLVDWCCQQGNMPQALQLIQQMADNGLQPQAFLSDATMAQVQQVGGLPGNVRAGRLVKCTGQPSCSSTHILLYTLHAALMRQAQ
jgi:pentatricopeptide repeat protein